MHEGQQSDRAQTSGEDVSRPALEGDGTLRRHPPMVPAPALVLASVVGIQAGHACGKLLFGLVHPLGVVALRLGFAALVLAAIRFPRVPTDRRSLGLVLGWGTAIAGMNMIYPALERLPVGAAVTLQFLGPLTMALAASRRPHDLFWAGLAGCGVFLFYSPGDAALSTSGVAFALASGASWAVYILLTRRLGALTTDGSALALAAVWAAVLSVPIGVVMAGPDLARSEVLFAGLGIAVLSAVVPWSLDLAALRRMSSRVFGVLVSLEPALGGLAGLVILREHLTVSQWAAIGCVVAASMGVTWGERRRNGEPTTERSGRHERRPRSERGRRA